MIHFFCSVPLVRLVLVNLVSVNHNQVYRLAFFLLAVLLMACNGTPGSKAVLPGTNSTIIQLPAPAALDKAKAEQLRTACSSWYKSVLESKGFEGGMVVAKNGNVVFEAYNGATTRNGATLISDSTSLHIASVSKTFTAMAILKLSQDGKCQIDDAFSTYFPAFNYPGVTILTLLNHRSGLPNYLHFMEHLGWNKKMQVTNEDVLNYLITKRDTIENVGTPDKRFSYCNTNYALLALLVEKLSGKKFGDYLQETFFEPLQMKNTFVYNRADSGKVVMSYDYRGTVIPMNFLDLVYGDKNIYSSPRDLLTWDRALTSGLLFNPQSLAEAYTPYSNEKPGVRNYGLGWRMNIYPTGKKMIYHNGWWHGNNAAFIRLLEDSATIIVLGNKYNRGIYHAKDLSGLFGNYFGDGEEEDAEASPVTLQRAPTPKASTEKVKNSSLYTSNSSNSISQSGKK